MSHVLDLRLLGGRCSRLGLGRLERCELLLGRELPALGDDESLDLDVTSWKTSIGIE